MVSLVRARAALAALLALAALGTAPVAWSASADTPGAPGAIGVVDEITESSLHMNGLEIRYGEATPVTINSRPARAGDLALGQVVAVETLASAGGLEAHNIAILRVLEGPVTRVDPAARTIFVMGQAVRMTDQAWGLEPGQVFEIIRPGTTVHVSGHRNGGGEIVASRIDVAPPGENSAIGRMRPADVRSGEIGSVSISLAEPRPEGESDVLVRGRWDGERLRVGSVLEDPSVRLLGRVDRAVIESLVLEPRRGNSLRVGQLQVSITRATRIEGAASALRAGRLVRVTGVPDRRRGMAAERIEIPARAGARRGEALADRRNAAEDRADRQRADESPARSLERMERLERVRVERMEAARVERTESARVERAEPTRVERPEPARIEVRVERPERVERDDDDRRERVERRERSDRSGSNSGRD